MPSDIEASRGGTARRAAWGISDQVISAGSNLLVTILAARALSPQSFGLFALSFIIYGVVVALVRGISCDPLIARHSGEDRETLRREANAAAATALIVAVGIAAITAGVAVMAPDSARPSLLSLALVLPGLALQDCVRFVLVAQGETRKMFLNDLLWLVLELPLMAAAIALGGGAGALVFAWGVAGTVAAGLGLRQAGNGLPEPRAAWSWLSRHRTLWPYFAAENLLIQGTILVLALVVTLAASLDDVAAFRGAMLLYAPLGNLGRGVLTVLLPELARRRQDPRLVRRAGILVAWLLAALTLPWAAATALISDSVGHQILGSTWPLAEPLLLLAAAPTAASLFSVGTAAGLRAVGAGRAGLAARAFVSTVILLAASIGGILDGAHGVMVALAVTSPAQMATYWWLLNRATLTVQGQEQAPTS